MHLVGFNARQIREGTSKRGLRKSLNTQIEGVNTPVEGVNGNEQKSDDDDIAVIRGPVCPQFISFFISAILASALELFFNKVISILAANSFFPKHIRAVMDASEIESTERCVGCGKVTKEKAPELRRRGKRIRKIRLPDLKGNWLGTLYQSVNHFRPGFGVAEFLVGQFIQKRCNCLIMNWACHSVNFDS